MSSFTFHDVASPPKKTRKLIKTQYEKELSYLATERLEIVNEGGAIGWMKHKCKQRVARIRSELEKEKKSEEEIPAILLRIQDEESRHLAAARMCQIQEYVWRKARLEETMQWLDIEAAAPKIPTRARGPKRCRGKKVHRIHCVGRPHFVELEWEWAVAQLARLDDDKDLIAGKIREARRQASCFVRFDVERVIGGGPDAIYKKIRMLDWVLQHQGADPEF